MIILGLGLMVSPLHAEEFVYESSFRGGWLAGAPVQLVLQTEGTGATRTLADVVVRVDLSRIDQTGTLLRASEGLSGRVVEADFSVEGFPVSVDVFYSIQGDGMPIKVDLFHFPLGDSFDVEVTVLGEVSRADFLRTDPFTAMSFAYWMERFGEVPGDQRGLLDQPRGDGIPNVLKYAFGWHPAEAWRGDSSGGLQLARNGEWTEVQAGIPAWLARPDLAYGLERSVNLIDWETVAEADGEVVFAAVAGENAPASVVAGEAGTAFEFEENEGRVFYRLQVEPKEED